MRRVGIGVELAADASILLLDEPTSALDAVNTRLVVGLLRALANSGMLVIASIHQPRLSAYEMFDKLLLLRKGHLVYGGEASTQAVSYFNSLGFRLPERHNPADFFIEVCFGFVDSSLAPPVQLDELGARWADEYQRQRANEDRRLATRGIGRATWDEFEAFWTTDAQYKMLDRATAVWIYDWCVHEAGSELEVTWADLFRSIHNLPMPRSSLPSAWHQFWVCLRRCLLKRVRLRRRFLAQQAIIIMLATIAGGITGPDIVTDTAMLCATVALFGTYVSTLSIETVCQGAEDELFEHECAGGVAQSMEITARMLADILAWSLLPLLYGLPFASLANIGWKSTGEMLCILYLLMWAMQPIGYVVTLLTRKDTATVAVSSLSLIFLIFMNTQLGPSLRSWGALGLAMSPARWATPAFCLSYINSRPFGTARAQLEAIMLRTGVLPGEFTMKSLPTTRAEVLEQMRTVVRYSKGGDLLGHLEYCASETDLPPPPPPSAPPPLVMCTPTNSTSLGANATDAANASISTSIDAMINATNITNATDATDASTLVACEPAAGPSDSLPVERAILAEYDALDAVDWLGSSLLALFLIGLLLRVVAILLFYKRTRAWAQILGPRAVCILNAVCLRPSARLFQCLGDCICRRARSSTAIPRADEELPQPKRLPPYTSPHGWTARTKAKPRSAFPNYQGEVSTTTPPGLTKAESEVSDNHKLHKSMKRLLPLLHLTQRSHKDQLVEDQASQKDRPPRRPYQKRNQRDAPAAAWV